MVDAKAAAEGLDRSPSAAAQQLSASAWLTLCLESEDCAAPVCIAHAPPSAQHAIRASGVATQPAHTTA